MGNTSNLKQLKPTGGSGDIKPVVGYLSIKRMKEGEEFKGTYRSTYSKKEKNDRGQEVTKHTHYFTANGSGKFKKVTKDMDVSIIEYKVGDDVGINGTAQLDDMILQVKPGAKLTIIKKGEKLNPKTQRTTQLVDVFVDESEGGAAATDDNDSFDE